MTPIHINDIIVFMENAVEIKNLSKLYKLYEKPSARLADAVFPHGKKSRYSPFYALSDISFSVARGETVGIIGKNGSGKSTLLKILTGVITQSGGEVNVNGRVSALLELGAGFNPEYSGIENIFLNGTIMGFTQEETAKKLDEIIDFAEIGDFINQPVKTYSSGMFVRLAFAVAINVDPEILIVDEALAVGDYRFQAKCYNKFEELKEQGKTILFVTHDVDAVRRFCTRAIWIDSGKLVLDGPAPEVTAKYMEFITGGASSPDENGEIVLPPEEECTEFDPINRFGSNVGTVYYVQTFKDGLPCTTFSIGDKVRVDIKVDIPQNADLKYAGVSISVKDRSGLDLFGTSTSDKDILFDRPGKHHLEFEFINYLNQGEYTIAAALESRRDVPITYFDYIEGAAYIKVSADREYFGVGQFPSEVRILKNKS